ncbi:MAG TPA: sugar efflux transporter [Polyangiaceae bacterium]|nr:sugar efflux transporter [Polyangiaceae bacterium]
MQRLAEHLRPVSRLYAQSAYRRLVWMNLLLGFAMSFVQPFMSMFGTIEAKMSLAAFGAFMTCNALAGIAIATTLAHYSDTRMSRRTVLLAGSVAGALGYAGYAYFRGFWPLLFVGTVVLGVSSITFSQLFAYARELLAESNVPAAENAFYINFFRMFIALAWTVGPAIAAAVMIRFSYRGLFLGAALNFALLAAVVWFSVPANPPRKPRTHAGPSASLLRLFARGDLLAHFAAFVLITASTTIGMMNLPLLITDVLRGTAADVGTAYSVAPIFELPFMLLFGWLATRYPAERIIRVGMVFSLAYYLSLTLATSPWHVYLAQSLSAAATAVISGVAITYFQSHLPHHPGTATNLYANATRIGSTAGYFLFSVLAWRFGYRAVFDACELFAIVALGLMLVPVAHRPEPIAEAALETAGARPKRETIGQ